MFSRYRFGHIYTAFFFAGAAAVILSLFTACGSGRSSEDEDQVKYLIGMSQANLVEPWRVTMNEEIRQEAEKHKDLRVVVTDAAQSSKKQIKDVEQLLQQGIDLLIISPNDSAALTPIVTEAYKKIPVIVLDRAVEGYDYTLFIGPDNRFIGRQAGKFVAELLGSCGGNVIEIQGLSGSPPVRDRSEGFREVIDQHENIKIVDTIVADWQRDMAEDKMKEVLARHPDASIVFAQNDPMAYGAYKAALSQNIQGLKFVGIDGLPGEMGGLQLVKSGILTGTFRCPTGGKEAIQYAVDILNKEKGLPKKIILMNNIITKDNVGKLASDSSDSRKPGVKSERKIVVGFAQVGSESMWREANSLSIQSAAVEAGVELKVINAQSSQDNQIKAIRTFIRDKVDVIAFSPLVETGWDEVLKEAKAAGIPVICSDRAVKVNDDTLNPTFIGSDFVEEGRRAARWLVEKMKGKKDVKIVELRGTIGSAPEIGRKEGFEEVIKDSKEFHIAGSQTGEFTLKGGMEAMTNFLKQYGKDIDVVYAHNDDMAFGAIEAIESYGLKPGKDIIIVSIDGVRRAFKEMTAGRLNCTVECNPLLGPQLMKAVKDYMEGKELPIRIIMEEGVFPEEVASKEYKNRKY